MQCDWRRWKSVFALGTFLAFGVLLRAQTTYIEGTVADATGKVLPGASVTVETPSGNPIQKLVTDDQGRFVTPALPVGTYSLEVSATGFGAVVHPGVQVAAGANTHVAITLNVAQLNQSVTVESSVSIAADLAPVQTPLDTHSARSEISQQYIENFTDPTADFTNLLQMAPGTFNLSPNGDGLGQSNIYFRGFADGDYTMSFDGIPFEDTNTPTHHSWAFFPSEWIGGVDFDRSPGTASTVGPTNFGGAINLESRPVQEQPDIRATVSYGSWDTRLLDLSIDSGTFGPGGKSSLTADVHQLLSDGYQTFNDQKRDGGALKYQYKVSDKTTISAFLGVIDLWNNTPNFNGATRAQIQEYGDNYLMSGNPTAANWYGFDYYHIQTNFDYVNMRSDLGSGWTFNNSLYNYRYWNKQNYNSQTTITTTSAVDKLNGYNKYGDIMSLSKETKWGTIRTGMWYEWAYTDRYQVPRNPLTEVDSLLPNFHEHFITQSTQPYVEYEWRTTRKLSITGGVRFANYLMNLDQYQDNGGKVGCLGGILSTSKAGPTTTCIGGPGFANHSASYGSWMPSVDARYRLTDTWSAYAQYATGSVIPPSSVFDVPGGNVETLPKPTTVETEQVGAVVKRKRFTVDFDMYRSHFQNGYASYTDPVTTLPIYYETPDSITRGLEGEGNYFFGHGISAYANFTFGKAFYEGSELWVADTPRNTQSYGVTYQRGNWDFGIFDKRVGQLYNDNGSTHEAINIDPFSLTNVYINYTLRNVSYLRGSKVRLSMTNLFDNHNLVGVTPASTATAVPNPNDILTLLPGRSIMVLFTAGWAPKR